MSATQLLLAAAVALPCMSLLATPKTAATPQGRPQSASTALIVGRVLDAVSNQPISGSTVTIGVREGARGQGSPTSVLTTDAGYFLFRDVPPGVYPMLAAAPRYLAGGHGQQRIAGPTQPLSIEAGARANITIRLWPEAELSGAVTDETGEPVIGISVSLLPRELLLPGELRRSNAALPVARTDSAGTYRFTGLLPGDYVVSIPTRLAQVPIIYADADSRLLESVRASGFAAVASGLRTMGPLVRVGDMFVQASTEGSSAGTNAFLRPQPGPVASAATLSGYPSTFFPGTPTVTQAQTIRLSAGEQRRSVNLQLTPAVFQSLSGRIAGANGAPAGGIALHLVPAFAAHSVLERSHESGITISLPDGSFSFMAVAPGDYVIKAWQLPQSLVIGNNALPSEQSVWATTAVTIADKPITNVIVRLQAGSAIRGHVIHDGAAAPNPPARLQTALSVAFEPAWPLAFLSRLSARVSPEYEFVTQGVPPGAYFPVLPNQFLAPQGGWFFESATREGKDLMLSPIVVEAATDVDGIVLTLADRRTTLSGTITDAAGRPASAAAVVVFPADLRTWIQNGLPPLAAFSGAASQTGAFSLDVRPGEYLAAAINEARLDDWRSEPALRSLAAQAVRIKIARGDNPGQSLRVSTIRIP